MVQAEQQYLDLLRDLLDAPFKDDRTNTGTRTKFVHNLNGYRLDSFEWNLNHSRST